MRTRPLLGIVLGLLGCGSRSQLLGELASSGGDSSTSGAGANGAGGSSISSSSSGAGGFGGAGGSSSCNGGIVLTGGELTIEPTSAFHQRRPALRRIGPEGLTAVLVIGLDAVAAPGPAPSPIADLSFAPWGTWPPVLEPPTAITAVSGDSFAIDGGSGDTYSLLYNGNSVVPREGMRFDPFHEPGAPPAGFVLRFGPARAVFAASIPGFHLAALEPATLEPSNPFTVMLLSKGGVMESGDFACKSPVVPARALAAAEGFLVATPTSACDDVPPPATTIQFFHFTPFGETWVSPGATLETGRAIEGLEIAPRSDGAVLALRTVEENGQVGPVEVRLVDGAGNTVSGPFEAAPSGRGPFALSPLPDQGFALTWIEPPGPAGQRIGVRFYDASAALLGETFVTPAPDAVAGGPLALLGSETFPEVVVGWSGESTTGDEARIHLARVACQ
jgi:hypothetical protein